MQRFIGITTKLARSNLTNTVQSLTMSDILELISVAWEKLRPGIEKDPDELARRLARRRAGMMRRPPRAWCLAARASDTRINPASAACVPEDAAYPANCLGPG